LIDLGGIGLVVDRAESNVQVECALGARQWNAAGQHEKQRKVAGNTSHVGNLLCLFGMRTKLHFLLSLIAGIREQPKSSARNDMPCGFISYDAGAPAGVSCLF
jgi:hypothetical protein